MNKNAFGLMCTCVWTELVQAMQADKVDLSGDKVKGGPKTRAVIEKLVRDTLDTGAKNDKAN